MALESLAMNSGDQRSHYCCDRFTPEEYGRNHEWSKARKAALGRDEYKCVRCGIAGSFEKAGEKWRLNLSVNHISPRRGEGYGHGCHNHLDNLETLCWPCHHETTRQQNRDAGAAGLACRRRKQRTKARSPRNLMVTPSLVVESNDGRSLFYSQGVLYEYIEIDIRQRFKAA